MNEGGQTPRLSGSELRSDEKVRSLSARDLGVYLPATADTANQNDVEGIAEEAAEYTPSGTFLENSEDAPRQLSVEIQDDNELLMEVIELLKYGFAGVIFTGPPGTGKSWYAAQIGMKLANEDPKRVRFIQFHASYQYEDFVEGYVPDGEGGFRLKPKHLLEMCAIAKNSNGECVLVIDELSRSDPGRILGEALTYMESTKRGLNFSLASGTTLSIPDNLVFLATMNPMDRGVDEVDAALERRFAKIAMTPSASELESFLEENGMDEELRTRVMEFFEYLLHHDNPYCVVGHAYFRWVKDGAGLNRLWNNQLRFHMEKAFRLDTQGFKDIEDRWNAIFDSEHGQVGGANVADESSEDPDEV